MKPFSINKKIKYINEHADELIPSLSPPSHPSPPPKWKHQVVGPESLSTSPEARSPTDVHQTGNSTTNCFIGNSVA